MSVSGRVWGGIDEFGLGRNGVGVSCGGIGQQCWEREFGNEFRCPGQSPHAYTHHIESSGEDGPNVERTYSVVAPLGMSPSGMAPIKRS